MKVLRPGGLITPLLLMVLFTGMGVAQDTRQVPTMTAEELRSIMDDPDVTILDVRQASDWNSSGSKIPGAVHHPPEAFVEWADAYPRQRKLVLYCA
jgi:rhodanese-related sulfurtransferase